MENVLLVIHLLVAIALIFVVLMQRSAQDGGGLMGGGGTMGGLFTSRGSANLLSRTTAVLATLFIVLSLLQGFIAAQKHKTRSIAEQIESTAPATQEPEKKDAAPAEKAAETPAAPVVPVSK
jgi:preprotein translocase subunit SecG